MMGPKKQEFFGQESTYSREMIVRIMLIDIAQNCQKVPISDFQSQFSISKIIRIFLTKIFIEEYDLRGTLLVIDIFENLDF